MRLVCTSTLVLACQSKACAPPPVGTGGSKGTGGATSGRRSSSNTSMVPKDTRTKVQASNDHPEAPGAGNRKAVRGHKGVSGDEPERRIPRLGETVDIYRDLGRGRAETRGFEDGLAFSVRMAARGATKAVASRKDADAEIVSKDVVATTVGIRLANGRPAWANAAKAAAESTGKRGVHAFVRGEVKGYEDPKKLLDEVRSDPGWEEVKYYPGTQDFFRSGDRHRFTGADEVVMVNGKMYAKNAKWIDTPAPVSPIEKKMAQSETLGLMLVRTTPVYA